MSVEMFMRALEAPGILQAILESLRSGVYFVGKDQKILFWNEGAERITGYLSQEVVGHYCRDVFPAASEDEPGMCHIGGALAEALRDGKPTCSDVAIRHRAGHQVFLRIWATPIRDADGIIIGASESFDEDRTSRESDRRHRKLDEHGCVDQTSGVLSFGYIRTVLKECLLTFAEHGLPFSIACVRIDRLPELRAQYGPVALRGILHAASETITNGLRPTDCVGRWNDESFLAVLPECHAIDAERVAGRLQKVARNMTVKWWDDEIQVTAAIAAVGAERSDTVESLIGRIENRLARNAPAASTPAIRIVARKLR
jgi:PAS domain S-box-containing protein/diguanylate cyclase (GGDEF)-like protein